MSSTFCVCTSLKASSYRQLMKKYVVLLSLSVVSEHTTEILVARLNGTMVVNGVSVIFCLGDWYILLLKESDRMTSTWRTWLVMVIYSWILFIVLRSLNLQENSCLRLIFHQSSSCHLTILVLSSPRTAVFVGIENDYDFPVKTSPWV